MSITTVEKKFISIMEAVGKDAEKGLSDVVKYLPEASALAALIFPQDVATIAGVVNSVDLVQNAVVLVEQKMAAAGKATGTGTQKAADVLTVVTPVVTQLLTAEKISCDAPFVTKIVNAVVAILNVKAAAAPAVAQVAPAVTAAAALG
jgi:hypothetical protein